MNQPDSDPRQQAHGAGNWREPLLVFGLALLVTGALVAGLVRTIAAQDRAAFHHEVERSLDVVRERIATTVTLLRGAAGLFNASLHVERPEFAAYVDRLLLRERYPGILGIGFSQRVPASLVAEVEADMRRHLPDFRIWPQQPAGTERHSILFLEPLDERNRAAIGYDMSTDPVRREAMEAARDSGRAAASGKVTLVQEIDTEKQAGFLIYVPVYRTVAPPPADQRAQLLHGFVYSPLRVGDLLRRVRGGGEAHVDLEVYDGAASADSLLLSTRTPDTAPHRSRLSAEHVLDVAGRPWLLRFSSRSEFERLSQWWLVPWMALTALATSALLAWMTWVQVRARHGAETAASERRQQAALLHASEERERERSARLQQLAAASPMLNSAASLDTLVRAIEDEARRLLDAPSARLSFGAEPPRQAPGSMVVALTGRDGRITAHLAVAARPQRPYGADDDALLRHLVGIASIAVRNARLYAELRANDRRKDEFLATLAHELRNPLAPICSALDVMRLHPEGPHAAKARDVADRQARHMVRLIDDLLDLSRISRGTIVLQREPMALADAVDSAVESSRPLIDARDHQLQVGPIDRTLQVDGDPTRLAQVFANLLNNAAKYTEPGGELSLAMGREDGRACVRVRDNGIGIEPDNLAHVFDMFMQADRTLERSSGLGIGLTLVRRLVEMHGGTVEARSDGPGRGCEFVVRLPLLGHGASGHAAHLQRGGTSGAPPPLQPLRVLLVDDNVDAAEQLAVALRLDGHRVETVHDGLAALHAAERFDPEVVLLDIGLPGLNGYEVARRLRLARGGAARRLVAITGWGQESDRQRAREAGFDLHLVKPVDYAALVAELARLAQIDPPRQGDASA